MTSTTAAATKTLKIGDRMSIPTLAAAGPVVDFAFGSGSRAHYIVAAYIQTDLGRLPVKVKRDTICHLADGDTARAW